ncbi:MAG: hypothetical protein QXS16_04885 [Pyrobaculum sp.]
METGIEQKTKREKKQVNIGIHADIYNALIRVKKQYGYKSYSAIIDTLIDEFGNVDLMNVDASDRGDRGEYLYLALARPTYERLTQLYRKYRMTYDMIVYKLMKLKGWM